jgi:hypothetical protein
MKRGTAEKEAPPTDQDRRALRRFRHTKISQAQSGVNPCKFQPEPLGRIRTGQPISDSGQRPKTRRSANAGLRSGNYGSPVPRLVNLVGGSFRERWLAENVRCDWLDWLKPQHQPTPKDPDLDAEPDNIPVRTTIYRDVKKSRLSWRFIL